MGRRQALAGAVPRAAVAAARASPAGRAVLRRPRGRARAAAGAGAAERRQPARHRLLPLAAARPADRPAARERRDAVLRAPRPLQRAARRRRGRRRRSGRPLLLPEPHRLQRLVPLQPQGRLQRAVRLLQGGSATCATSPPGATCWRRGCSRTATSSRFRSTTATSSTPIRPTTCPSRNTRGAASRGTTRCARRPGSRRTAGPSCS
jgi:hypothetical protein